MSNHSVVTLLQPLLAALSRSELSVEQVIDNVKSAKDQFIDAVRPDYRPFLLRSYTSEADCRVLDRLETVLYELIAHSRTLGPLMVRYEYLRELEERPGDVERSLEDYVTVIGATCQQAAGDQMLSIKETSETLGIVFDTVIVDEAARAAPLDLMIPMAMAKRRIVLVGDHFQLPHMLEPRVEAELQELDTVKSELLHISLFEYLHRQFLQMHKKGGQCVWLCSIHNSVCILSLAAL